MYNSNLGLFQTQEDLSSYNNEEEYTPVQEIRLSRVNINNSNKVKVNNYSN
jgi:hypothetical protein